MTQTFKYYLHDNADSSERRAELERQGILLSDAAWENMGRPFYEVTLECEVDNDGTVRIVGVGL